MPTWRHHVATCWRVVQMIKNQISRQDFIRQTVSNTLDTYLRIYCAPYTIQEAQARCIRDAERLADTVYGCVEMPQDGSNIISLRHAETKFLPHAETDVRPAKFQLQAGTRAGASMTRRLKHR